MQIIKEKIVFNGNDGIVKIPLSSYDGFLGSQQEIDNLTDNMSKDLINPPIDGEKIKFTFKSINIYNKLDFRFNTPTPLFANSDAGFTEIELMRGSANVLNSFFILDYYDSYNQNVQSRIFTTYITKIGHFPIYIIGIHPNTHELVNNQISNLYIPKWYLNKFTTRAIGYAKLSFYNAKSGNTTLFYNNAFANYTTQLKMYFRVDLDLVHRTWRFMEVINNIVDARALTTSAGYTARIDNTLTKQKNIKQVYPPVVGSDAPATIFDYNTGTYE